MNFCAHLAGPDRKGASGHPGLASPIPLLTRDEARTGWRRDNALKALYLALAQQWLEIAIIGDAADQERAIEQLSDVVSRRFPPPWSAEETDASFIVRDARRSGARYRKTGGQRHYWA